MISDGGRHIHEVVSQFTPPFSPGLQPTQTSADDWRVASEQQPLNGGSRLIVDYPSKDRGGSLSDQYQPTFPEGAALTADRSIVLVGRLKPWKPGSSRWLERIEHPEDVDTRIKSGRSVLEVLSDPPMPNPALSVGLDRTAIEPARDPSE